MGIPLAPADLDATLDRALRDARDPAIEIDPLWAERTRWFTQQLAARDAGGKTYVAATGAALLAKATNGDVDTLTQHPKAGSRGYNLRSVATRLQKRVRGIAHLGTLSKDPVNNRPFLGGNPRLDRIDNVAGYLSHVFDTYIEWLRELDGYSVEQANAALVAFLRVRMEVQVAEDARAADNPRMRGARSAGELLDVVQLWMTKDSEHGARGQAVVAAVLGLVWDDVEVVPKHNPAPFDVMRKGKPSALVAEVKQQSVTEAEILELARRASADGCSAAMYAIFARDQAPVPQDRLRADASRQHGIFLEVVHDTQELVAKVAVFSGLSIEDVAANLPQALFDRCRAAGVTPRGADDLAELLQAIGD